MKLSAPAKRTFRYGLAGALLLSCAPAALHAETSNADLAKQIAELKAQINAMKGTIAKKKVIREVVVKTVAPGYAPPLAIPAGATPVFVTADKKLQYGSLTITPGGYIDVNGIFRSRDLQNNVTSGYNTIPFNNSNLAHVNETRFSIQQSRFALLIESPIAKNTIVAGYAELDLNNSGTATNNGQTGSFIPRIRNIYATGDFNDYGFHVLAGQNWSLVTMNSKGITPRNEVLTPGLDSGVQVGYTYARTPQIRIVKDFDKKLWIALAVEQEGTTSNNNGACTSIVSNTSAAATPAATSIAANALTGVAGGTCIATGGGGFAANTGQLQQVSLSAFPDVLAKIAYEARIADRDVHLEALGVFREFTNYVNYNPVVPAGGVLGAPAGTFGSSNQQNAIGYGIGAAIIVPVLPKKLDFQAQGLIGRGLGRYSSSGVPDAAVNAYGNTVPLGYASANAGVIYHATPSFDLYAFAGFEQVARAFSITPNGTQVGYGLTQGVDNRGCEYVGGTCAGQTHRNIEFTLGFNDKLYKGAFGEVRVGVQYEYVQRNLFAATANTAVGGGITAAAPLVGAKASDNIVFTSLRYFPFQ